MGLRKPNIILSYPKTCNIMGSHFNHGCFEEYSGHLIPVPKALYASGMIWYTESHGSDILRQKTGHFFLTKQII
jgi:hypothetical protein